MSIPASFFVTAPLSVIGAGMLLLLGPGFVHPLHPSMVALTHLGTLGFLGMVMFGALYQMLPVVAGSPVFAPRSAHAVHGFLTLGLLLSVAGLLSGTPIYTALGGTALFLAVLGFLGTVAPALIRAPVPDSTVWGMRLSVTCLAAVALLGLWMGQGHSGGVFPGARTPLTAVHLGLALLGWVGSLLVSISWRVVPMFYLTEEVDPRHSRGMVLGMGLGLIGFIGALFLGSPALWMVLPAVAVVWAWHPFATLRALRSRRRKRAEGSLLFWQGGLLTGLLCGPAAFAALNLPSERAPLLFGWLAIWGWAGMVMHGTLCRILPFLVWFHRLSPWIGRAPVPPMRRILPDSWVRRGFWIHLVSVVLGAAAILLESTALGRLTGAALILVGISLGYSLLTVLRVQAPTS